MKVGFIGFGKRVHRYHMPSIDMIDSIEVIGYWARGQSKFDMPYPFPVSRFEVKVVINILETIVNNRVYKKM